MTTPLLKVDDLHIALAGDGVTYDAVENVSFEIGRGEAFGLVGESGCGKSITALAVMGLLRRPLSLSGGRIVLDGQEIQDVSAAETDVLQHTAVASADGIGHLRNHGLGGFDCDRRPQRDFEDADASGNQRPGQRHRVFAPLDGEHRDHRG